MRKIYITIGVSLATLLTVTGVSVWLIFFNKSQEAVDKLPKLVIDHDGGADDALAITMCLRHDTYFNGPEVIALTTTHGNVNLSQVIVNSRRILDVANRPDVLIYSGAEKALVKGIESDYYFGKDGLGDDGYISTSPVDVEYQHAAVALVELSKKYEGELIILAIGPLTNIALAISLDSKFISRLKHLYVGGGDVTDEQNPEAPEFNADMDVEGYNIVARAATPDKATFVPFSQIKSSLTITNDWRQNVLGAINTPLIKALNGFERLSFAASSTWTLMDPAVAAMALNSTMITEIRNSNNSIILCGEERGVTTNNFSSTEPNLNIVYAADVDFYKQFLIDIYSAELSG